MDIQSAFFEDFTSLHKDMQIIILENKEPKEEVKEKINYKEFTKDEKEGRYGFFLNLDSEIRLIHQINQEWLKTEDSSSQGSF
ncbi:hypothetical protein [Bacillus inaquosorum]|uniref:hypothetical protein n=1 Tax=Bacillus inaquosorum TaxID=483913 RepID=UPI0022828F4F|nr:hypothetical protein [Bacillus inaquosorum]MCY7949363.1 hypothetical protein [Bacillus inaquosorum]MEC0520496.1 hypothetical protein [Bacillus inaquosorum]MEC0607299.1 hypothetical protein [Bacillus inaquosorum]